MGNASAVEGFGSGGAPRSMRPSVVLATLLSASCRNFSGDAQDCHVAGGRHPWWNAAVGGREAFPRSDFRTEQTRRPFAHQDPRMQHSKPFGRRRDRDNE